MTLSRQFAISDQGNLVMRGTMNRVRVISFSDKAGKVIIHTNAGSFLWCSILSLIYQYRAMKGGSK